MKFVTVSELKKFATKATIEKWLESEPVVVMRYGKPYAAITKYREGESK